MRSLSFLVSIIIIVFFILMGFSTGFTYEHDYSGEPAGDVTQFDQYGNASIVGDVSDPGLSKQIDKIDLKGFVSENGTGDNLTFTLSTKGKNIITDPDVKYVIRVFTERNNQSGYNITYKNGSIEITRIVDNVEVESEDISHLGGVVEIRKNEYGIEINIPKSVYFPEDSLDYFNVDAFSWMEKGEYTYVDYINNQPGNPGTISSDIIDDSVPDKTNEDKNDDGGGMNSLILVLIIIIVIVIIIAVVMKKGKKK